MESIKLIENFYSFQGEGPDSGQTMLILRFKQCDRVEHKKPCPWCDTLVKMRIQNEASYDILDIQKGIQERKYGILITGGECTFGDDQYNETLSLLRDLDYPIANVETNGYDLAKLLKEINKSNIKFMYSPKIFNEEDLQKEIKRSKLIKSDERVFFKIVCEDNDFINEYLDFISDLNISRRVYLMTEGKTREELINNSPRVFDKCEEYNFNFSSRMHIMYNFV